MFRIASSWEARSVSAFISLFENHALQPATEITETKSGIRNFATRGLKQLCFVRSNLPSKILLNFQHQQTSHR